MRTCRVLLCESVQSGEKNVGSTPKSSIIVDPQIGLEGDVDNMRGKDQEGNAAETIEHASSQEILKEAPSLAHVDGMTHQEFDGDGDGDDEDERNVDVEEDVNKGIEFPSEESNCLVP